MTKQKLSSEQLARFATAIAGDVLSDELSRAMYSTDASVFQITPALVVCPRNTKDVQETLRLAERLDLSLTPRGAASGLGGECLTTGIALDFARYCNRILDVDASARTATVEPGCVLQRLNDTLAPQGLGFGPDPSSGNRATMGGIIGNNATGAHSIRYGHASDNIHWIDAVLADGTAARFHADGRVEADEPSRLRETIVDRTGRLLGEWAERIEENWPATDRNRAGYAVKDVRGPDGTVNWCKLLAGSEGTLAVFTAAQLRLHPVPPVKMLVQVNFDSILDMARSLPAVMATGCAACELMDGKLLEMARQAHGGPHPYLPDVAASLLIEHDGQTAEDVAAACDRTLDTVKHLAGVANQPVRIVEPVEQARLWTFRKNAVPLLFRQRNGPQPTPFIEDSAVPVEKMGEYIEALQEIFAAEGVSVAYYAHAGHGELHIRPYMDLHQPTDRQKMVRIARKTFEVVWRCGGTISGEHGCGRIRSGWLAQQYGQVCELFGLIKQTFDPHGRLNPGNVVTDRGPEDMMTAHLRFEHGALPERLTDTALHWEPDELIGEIEVCNGCGACRGLEDRLAMCPIFRAVGSEAATPRAKANLMRHIVAGSLDESTRRDERFRAIADLCVNCRSCLLECPSAVNVPKLMREAKSYYAGRQGMPRVEAVLSRGRAMGLLGSRLGRAAGLALKIPPARWVMEKLTGVDRRRPMPAFALGTFARKARRLTRRARPADPVAKVCYFVDLFANYHDHALGRAVLDVLAHNNVEVIVPPQKSAAMPAIDYGDLKSARKEIDCNLDPLLEAIDMGCQIVCSEPTAALCLKEEWLDVLHCDRTRKVADHTHELMRFLLDLHNVGRLKTDFRRLDLHLAYHAPCHLKALRGPLGGVELVRLVPGVRVDVLQKGCCGIAGTFGFQKRNYDLSIAAGKPMLDALGDAPAPFGMSECSTCRMQMEHVAGKFTFHPIKILALAYGYSVKGVPPAARFLSQPGGVQ